MPKRITVTREDLLRVVCPDASPVLPAAPAGQSTEAFMGVACQHISFDFYGLVGDMLSCGTASREALLDLSFRLLRGEALPVGEAGLPGRFGVVCDTPYWRAVRGIALLMCSLAVQHACGELRQEDLPPLCR